MSTPQNFDECHQKRVLSEQQTPLSKRPPNIPPGFLAKTAAEAEAERKAKLAKEERERERRRAASGQPSLEFPKLAKDALGPPKPNSGITKALRDKTCDRDALDVPAAGKKQLS
ncbi:MAG: hypothetical protein MMC33_006089 [Icmadophila ericetorum]|nr:hypothetical protein [Icmadophila ericetorum]